MQSSSTKTKILMFAGKGGVGKTTCSAATAVRCAELGYKTIVVSTDVTHTLGETLDVELSNEQQNISENLYAIEIDSQVEMKKHFGLVQEYFVELMGKKGVDELLAEELLVFPGLDEMFSFLRVKKLAEEGYDVIIIDCAPLGNTFRFLSFPELMELFRKGISAEKYVSKVLRPFGGLAERAISRPIPPSGYYRQQEELWEKVKAARQLFEDQNVTTVRLVTVPQRIVVSETQRGLMYINLFGYHVDSVIVNQVFPDDPDSAFLSSRKAVQDKYLELIEDSFASLEKLHITLEPEEIIGMEKLSTVGKEMYGERDPTHKLTKDYPFRIGKQNGQALVQIHLPFSNGQNIDVHTRGSTLQIDVGQYRRVFALPNSLASRKVKEAIHENETLKVYFTN